MTENWQLYQMEIILLQYSKFSKDDYTVYTIHEHHN